MIVLYLSKRWWCIETRRRTGRNSFCYVCLVCQLCHCCFTTAAQDGVERDFWKFDSLLVCHDKSELNPDKIIVFNNKDKDKDKLLHFENSPTDGDRKKGDLRKGLKSWLQGKNLQQRVLLAAPKSIRDIFQELLFEFGKVVDWEAPCYQYSLMPSIEEGASLGYQRDANAPLDHYGQSCVRVGHQPGGKCLVKLELPRGGRSGSHCEGDAQGHGHSEKTLGHFPLFLVLLPRGLGGSLQLRKPWHASHQRRIQEERICFWPFEEDLQNSQREMGSHSNCACGAWQQPL